MSNYLKITFWRFHLVCLQLWENLACGGACRKRGCPVPAHLCPWAPGIGQDGAFQPDAQSSLIRWDSVNRGHEENLEKIISFSLN